MQDGAKKTLLFVAGLGIFVMLFVVVNTKIFTKAGFIYLAFILSSLIILFLSQKFKGSAPNISRQVVIGVVGGLILISLTYTGFSIGTPEIPQSIDDTNKFLIATAGAGVSEELAFRVTLTLILGLLLPLILVIPIQAVAFSLFHITAYGSFGLQSGAFISALIFGLIAGIIATWKLIKDGRLFKRLDFKDFIKLNYISVIIIHMMLNAFIITRQLVVVG